MLSLYSGTPGSGKSLHIAMRIYNRMRFNNPTIVNFDVNNFKHFKGDVTTVYNEDLTVEFLKNYSKEYFKNHRFSENKILLVLDEAQILFNTRDFGRKDRASWLSFFTQHRHLGYEIVLIAQFDRMLDRQIRCLIEYEYLHRKVSNFGWRGWLLSWWCLGNLFCAVKMWYPLKERVDAEFFTLNRKYYRIYDSYNAFEMVEDKGGKKQ